MEGHCLACHSANKGHLPHLRTGDCVGFPGSTYYAQQYGSNADQSFVSAEGPEGAPSTVQQAVPTLQVGTAGADEGALTVPPPSGVTGRSVEEGALAVPPPPGVTGQSAHVPLPGREQVPQTSNDYVPDILKQVLEKIESIEVAVTRTDHACTTGLADMAARLDKIEAEVQNWNDYWSPGAEDQNLQASGQCSGGAGQPVAAEPGPLVAQQYLLSSGSTPRDGNTESGEGDVFWHNVMGAHQPTTDASSATP